MPRSKTIQRYPPEFLELMERFEQDHNEPYVIPCRDKKAADRLRFRLYGFLKVMKSDSLWQDYPEFFAAEFQTSADGRLTIIARSNTEEAQLVAAALKQRSQPKE